VFLSHEETLKDRCVPFLIHDQFINILSSLQKSSLQVEMVKVSRFFLTAFYMSEVASTGYPDFFHQPQIEGRIIWGENRFDYSLRVILLSERFEDFGVS